MYVTKLNSRNAPAHALTLQKQALMVQTPPFLKKPSPGELLAEPQTAYGTVTPPTLTFPTRLTKRIRKYGPLPCATPCL